jgi:hypothetical protein
VPRIDRYDRRYILMLAGFAASARRLCEVTPCADALRIYLTTMTGWQLELDRAVEKALGRVA